MHRGLQRDCLLVFIGVQMRLTTSSTNGVGYTAKVKTSHTDIRATPETRAFIVGTGKFLEAILINHPIRKIEMNIAPLTREDAVGTILHHRLGICTKLEESEDCEIKNELQKNSDATTM